MGGGGGGGLGRWGVGIWWGVQPQRQIWGDGGGGFNHRGRSREILEVPPPDTSTHNTLSIKQKGSVQPCAILALPLFI